MGFFDALGAVGAAIGSAAQTVATVVTTATTTAVNAVQGVVNAGVAAAQTVGGPIAAAATVIGGVINGALEGVRLVGRVVADVISTAGQVVDDLFHGNLAAVWVDLTSLPGKLWRELESEFDYQIFSDKQGRSGITSVPNQSAVAFSIAAVEPAQSPLARFHYRDSGKRYEFRLDHGAVLVGVDGGEFQAFSPDGMPPSAISFLDNRAGVLVAPPPPFDLIAANGARVLVKEVDKDNFFFCTMDDGYASFKRTGANETYLAVPGSYFKLDPQQGAPGLSAAPLTAQLAGDFNGHPSAERFALFSAVVATQLNDFMVVTMRTPRLWQKLDARPPRTCSSDGSPPVSTGPPSLIGALRIGGAILTALWGELPSIVTRQRVHIADILDVMRSASGDTPPPPAFLPSYPHVTYSRSVMGQKTPFDQQPRFSIDVKKVLSLGVGHAHLHDQYETIYGGEIQATNVEQPIAAQSNLNAVGYRIFNGPVRDADGFIDGTCNYYMLAQLMTDAAIADAQRPGGVGLSGAFGVLFIDEQAYFSQRWRLVHPADWPGSSFSLLQMLHLQPWLFDFQLKNFWCPFLAGHVVPESRMAVSRQVIAVTGVDPSSQLHEIYTVNFSWATCDRTWRWRPLPPGARVVLASADGEPTVQVPEDGAAQVYPQTLRLRDDMTLLLGGTRGNAIGRWYQRYLPPDQEHLPRHKDELADDQIASGDSSALRSAYAPGDRKPRKPKVGFDHPWQFVPETEFTAMDGFSHFGVYASVNARTQYYLIDVTPEAETVLATLVDDSCWEDQRDVLANDTMTFNWETAVSVGGDIRLDSVMRDQADLISGKEVRRARTQFHEHHRFKLLFRPPTGWIAVHWDKRDDDLMPFSLLPRCVTLTLIPDPGEPAGGVAVGPQSAGIRFLENRLVLSPPKVAEARLDTEGTRAGLKSASVVFRFEGAECDLGENVWTVHVGGIVDGHGREILSIKREGRFHRHAATSWYQCDLTQAELSDTGSALSRLCPAGSADLAPGATIWFEDIIGHVAPPGVLRRGSV